MSDFGNDFNAFFGLLISWTNNDHTQQIRRTIETLLSF